VVHQAVCEHVVCHEGEGHSAAGWGGVRPVAVGLQATPLPVYMLPPHSWKHVRIQFMLARLQTASASRSSTKHGRPVCDRSKPRACA
jgi:hypothetical protein